MSVNERLEREPLLDVDKDPNDDDDDTDKVEADKERSCPSRPTMTRTVSRNRQRRSCRFSCKDSRSATVLLLTSKAFAKSHSS